MIHSRPLAARRFSPDGLFVAVLLAIILFFAAQLLVARLRLLRDDWRYGRPRTMHLAAHVGHEDGGPLPTQFVAMNLNRRVVVFEIPGGDVAKTRSLTGPYLFGADEDLTPVRITLALINGDKEPDLVVSIKSEEVIYINDSGNYRLITDAERAALEATP